MLGFFSRKKSDKIEQITVTELQELLLQNKDLPLIDVRTPQEYALSRIPGVKVRIDYHVISSSIDPSLFPKDRPVYLYCRSGRRSLIAAKELFEIGYKRPINVRGGILQWLNKNLPSA